MAINYPTALDTSIGVGTIGAAMSTGGSTDGGTSQSHKVCHDDISSALVALETAVGTTNSSRLNLWTPSNNGVLAGPYNRRQYYDDFLYPIGAVSTSIALSSLSLPWVSYIPSAGPAIISFTSGQGQDAFNKAYGVWGCSTGTSATGQFHMYMNVPITPVLGSLDLYFRLAFSVVPTAAQNCNFTMGLNDFNLDYVNAIYLNAFYDASVGACWQGQCTTASATSLTSKVTTPVISAISSSALTYYKCQVSVNAAWNSVSFFVNGTQIGSAITTHIPQTLAVYPAIAALKTAGTTANGFFIDQFFMDYNYSV